MANESLDTYNGEGNETAENGFEEVSFEEIGDKLQQKFEEMGIAKPIFDKNTNATIKSVELNRATAPKKDKKGREYYDLILRVTCTVDEIKDDEGNPIETVDNYGGLREYPDGFWNGKKSAFGKLRQLVEDEFGVENYQEMLRKLPKAPVKIRTKTNEYNGETYQKNIIQMFR